MEPEREPVRCCFDDWVEHEAKRARPGHPASPVTAALLERLSRVDLAGRTVLDVGCGIGDLALETLRHGAARATGVDLSTAAIDEARGRAAAEGLADRARFEVGDGASAVLEPHDIVVLNRVICCYPGVEDLLSNTTGAARSVFAYTTPSSSGAIGLWNRARLAFENLWYRMRPTTYGGFRAFVHDCDRIAARLRAAGFRPLERRRTRLVWELAVFERAPVPSYPDASRK